jgi:5'-methylthioadenosine phosphorylase
MRPETPVRKDGHPTVAVIGGSGLYESGLFPREESRRVSTPWGAPSGAVEIGSLDGTRTLFLPRHGVGHTLPAHMVNYRANIDALVGLGAEVILAVNSVGSLKEDLPPGQFVLPDQFVDFTKGRPSSFYNGGRAFHVSMADPFCPALAGLARGVAKDLELPVASGQTYVCVEGPRFSTRAESRFFRGFADIIGMTLVPEASLARERGICYLPMCMVTDYDVWADHPVDAAGVAKVMAENVARVRRWVRVLIPRVPAERACACRQAPEASSF